VNRVEFSVACKEEVNKQEERQASDYRLDVRLRKECQGDVTKVCGHVDPATEYHADVSFSWAVPADISTFLRCRRSF
jgi:hypothetical protein